MRKVAGGEAHDQEPAYERGNHGLYGCAPALMELQYPVEPEGEVDRSLVRAQASMKPNMEEILHRAGTEGAGGMLIPRRLRRALMWLLGHHAHLMNAECVVARTRSPN